MPDGTKVATKQGTPQGSPLLSNIVLDEWDQELGCRGLRFARYADDCNIFVRSRRAGQRVMESTRRFLENKLRLQINEEKSSVTRPEGVHFLGFRFRIRGGNRVEVMLSAKTRARLLTRVRELTPRSWGQSLRACFDELNEYFRGWIGHFRICTEEGATEFQRYGCKHVLGRAMDDCSVFRQAGDKGRDEGTSRGPVLVETRVVHGHLQPHRTP